jgi:hypothetical protein
MCLSSPGASYVESRRTLARARALPHGRDAVARSAGRGLGDAQGAELSDYPDTNVWHSSVQNLPVHPMSTTWLANMGGPSRLLHPDFGGPYMRPVIDGTVWLEDQGVFWIIDVR